jgi:triacylglycerol esterase/lipase EstA (alpha/beta hydrolase family)
VEALLKATGATKVDILAHSMGSLNSRWYIKFLGGETKVDDWVSFGGPNHGTKQANICFTTPVHRDEAELDVPERTQCRRRDARGSQLRNLVVAVRRIHQPG